MDKPLKIGYIGDVIHLGGGDSAKCDIIPNEVPVCNIISLHNY